MAEESQGASEERKPASLEVFTARKDGTLVCRACRGTQFLDGPDGRPYCRKCGARGSRAATSGLGIACPNCGSVDTEVRKTERVPGAVQRYRRCRNCGHNLEPSIEH